MHQTSVHRTDTLPFFHSQHWTIDSPPDFINNEQDISTLDAILDGDEWDSNQKVQWDRGNLVDCSASGAIVSHAVLICYPEAFKRHARNWGQTLRKTLKDRQKNFTVVVSCTQVLINAKG